MKMDIIRVAYRWESQPGAEPGWHYQCFDAVGYRHSSRTVRSPVSLVAYGEDETAGLRTALQAEFPNADIEKL